MKPPQGITVIDLLLLMGGLVILAVIFLPGLLAPSEVRTQHKNDVVQIATAATAYMSEYGRPPATHDGIVGGEMLAALMGSNNQINPRQIVFLEVQNAKKGESGFQDGVFVDPWGVPYHIAFDSDNDGFAVAGTNGVKIPKQVAVWSDPSQEKSAAVRKRRYATSWE